MILNENQSNSLKPQHTSGKKPKDFTSGPYSHFLSPPWDFAMQMSEFLSGSLQKLDAFWTQKVHLKMKSTVGSLCGVFWFRSWRVWSCFHWIWLFLIQNHLFITFSVFSLTSCSRCFFLKGWDAIFFWGLFIRRFFFFFLCDRKVSKLSFSFIVSLLGRRIHCLKHSWCLNDQQ